MPGGACKTMHPYEEIVKALKAKSIHYVELDHDPVYTSEEAANIRGLSLDEGAKSLLLKTKDKFVLVVLSGSKKLDSKKLKKYLGVKDIRFASPAEVNDKLGCIVGACYPFGSIVGVETYVDKSLTTQSNISFNPGLHHKSIKISLSDYLVVENPTPVDVSSE